MLGERRSRLVVIMLLLLILLVLPNAIPITRGGSPETSTLRPNAPGTYTKWTTVYPAGIPHWDAVDDVTADDDGSYIETTTKGHRDTFHLPDIPSGASVSTVKVYVRHMRGEPSAKLRIMIRTYSTDYISPSITAGTTWTTSSYNWTTNPYTGTNWTVAEVNALEAGVQTSGAKRVRVTQVYVEVIYTLPPVAPIASFTYSPADPAVYETITFNASASYDPDGNIVSYEWDFGDGNITTVTDPIITHIYTTANSTVTYTVNLTVTDNEGLTNSTTDTVAIVNPSVLHISLPAGTYVGADPDPWISECWLLNVNDTSGTFTLRIEDVSGSIWSYDTHLIVALNDAAYNNLVNLVVDSVTIPKTAFKNGEPKPYTLYTWPPGDVYPTWFNDTLMNVGPISPKGHKNVTVSVTFYNATGARMHFDAYGSTDPVPPLPDKRGRITHNPLSEDSTVLFYPPPWVPPHASFTYSPPYLQVSETVTFNATESYDSDGYIVNYTWNFGDGNITWVTDPIITHHYTTFGNYTVNLTVTDNDGLTNSTTKLVNVREHPVASFTYLPSEPYVNEIVTFNASDSTPDGGYIVNYMWNFGDGNTTTVSDPIITHVYSASGNYTVTLNVTDSEGKWDTESKPIRVRVEKYYLTVISPYGTTGGQGWYSASDTAYATITPLTVAGPTGVQYVFTGWSGDASGPGSPSDPITMDRPKTAVANWKTQYLLVVRTDPTGLSPQPTRDPAGEAGPPGSWWYDNSTNVNLTAEPVTGYTFLNWDVDGTNVTGNPINVHMGQPHNATAHYVAPSKCVVDFTEDPKSPIYFGTTVTFTVNVTQKAFNGTHEVNCTLYEWNLTDPNGVSHILRYGEQWNNFSDTMNWTFNVYGQWTVTLRAFCDDVKLIQLDLAWSEPVSKPKYVQKPVGGYIAPIEKLSLLAPWIGIILALVAAMTATTTLSKYKSRKH